MRDPVWRRVLVGLLMALWVAVCFGWAGVLSHTGSNAGAVGGTVGVLFGLWIRHLSRRSAEKAHAALDGEDRGVVDDALAAGEPRGPVTLQNVEHALAQARLDRAGAAPRAKALWWAVLAVLCVVFLCWTPVRPPLLVAATVLELVGWAALPLAAPRAWALTAEERARLKAVTRRAAR